ncbi:MAG: nucleotidyltransferase family protein [Bacteroidota bacterium]|nr:nucleotidyltransferase family protein [Bacteroidota bacterium]MDP4204994.1 nucleotidyltransferase family protein [Bacteroidota bacterium]
MKAMIFAAGLGTRLKPYTETKPKALVELAGKPLLQHCIENLRKYGFTELVINVHHFGNQIIEFLEKNHNFGLSISVSDERECLLDTGGGLKKAAPLLTDSEPVLICNVDVLTDLNLNTLIEDHKSHNALATLVVRRRETSRYLLFDDHLSLRGWTNIKTGEVKESLPLNGEEQQLAFSGVHIVSPAFFNLITEAGKFSVIDLYLRLAKEHAIRGYIDNSPFWIDLGKPEELHRAEELLKAKK